MQVAVVEVLIELVLIMLQVDLVVVDQLLLLVVLMAHLELLSVEAVEVLDGTVTQETQVVLMVALVLLLFVIKHHRIN
jgi:hypothetical protein